MLDIKFIEENPAIVKNDLRKRHDTEKLPLVDELLDKHAQWKLGKETADRMRHSRNAITREINALRKAGKDFASKLHEAKALPKKIAAAEDKLTAVQKRMDAILQQLPNILHASVPYGKTEADNRELRKWGAVKKAAFPMQTHGALLESHDLADFRRATKIAGSGFYFLKGDMVLLEQALIRFALDHLVKKGFTPITVPLHLSRDPYEKVIELQAFRDVMYKLADSDAYLIGTSEHPIASMFSGELLETLPLKFAGLSTCFRKEIGSHGVDTRGLFRVHQFNKVELFVFSRPEDSWMLFDELLAIVEHLVQQLNLPYRVVNICTGDIGSVAAKKLDIEAWFPRQQAYREVVSCSNCTTYQSTGLNIRCRTGSNEKQYVHTLNCTALALSRIMAAIVENYQNKDGSITVPAVLVKHLGKKIIGKN